MALAVASGIVLSFNMVSAAISSGSTDAEILGSRTSDIGTTRVQFIEDMNMG